MIYRHGSGSTDDKYPRKGQRLKERKGNQEGNFFVHEVKMNFGGKFLNKFILFLLKALSFYCRAEIYLFSP